MRLNRRAFIAGAAAGAGCAWMPGFVFGAAAAGQGGRVLVRVMDAEGKGIPGAVAVSDDGRLAFAESDGVCKLEGLAPTHHAIRAFAPGFAETMCADLTLDEAFQPAGRALSLTAAPERGVVRGTVVDGATGKPLPAVLEIKDSDGPVRWFDTFGVPYGSRRDTKGWHQDNRRFWTRGPFAFSARGKVSLRATVDGYASVSMSFEAKAGVVTMRDIPMKRLFRLVDEGWYKGDFHAHAIHGESWYHANIAFMAFVIQAEHYDWFYLAAGYVNDGTKTLPGRLAERENTPEFFLALNAEYPKTYGGHIGNVGIDPPSFPFQHFPAESNVETLKKNIIDRGGAAVPVHPLCGHMKSRELPFILLGAPELFSGFDMYTGWKRDGKEEKAWRLLMGMGYPLCLTATSDTAFDVGRSPGTMGATYLKADRLPRHAEIVTALKAGCTAVAWEGFFLDMSVDGGAPGKRFPADGRPRHAVFQCFGHPGTKLTLEVFQNGELFKCFAFTMPETGTSEFTCDLPMKEKSWFFARLSNPGQGFVLAGSSPFYCGDWTRPAAHPARVTLTLVDKTTKKPLDGEVILLDGGREVAHHAVKGGAVSFEARIFHRLRLTVPGHASTELSMLDTPEVRDFENGMKDEDLAEKACYDKAASILSSLRHTVEF